MKKIFYFVSLVVVLFMSGCGGSSGSGTISSASNSVSIQGLDSNGNVDFEAKILINSAGVSKKIVASGDDYEASVEYTLDTDDTLLSSIFTLIDTNTSTTEVFTDYHQFSYDGEGNLLFAARDDDNYSASYTYDTNNLLISKESHEDGTYTYDEIEYYYYNAEDKLILSEMDWDVDGSVDRNSTFVYDGEGQLIEEFMSYMNSSHYKYIYTYNEDGKVIKLEEDWGNNGTFNNIITIQYESNKIILRYVTDNDQTIYTYDSTHGETYANNLVKEIVYGNSSINLKFNEELEKLNFEDER